MSIEVRIKQAEYDAFKNEVLVGGMVLNRLRKAGIPATGVFWLRSVDFGRLTMERDDVFDEMVFTWTDA